MNTSPFMECEGFHAVKGDVFYDRATIRRKKYGYRFTKRNS